MIKTLEDYHKQYNLSVSDPEKFWNDYSDQFIWRKKATKILDWNFESPDVKWFQDGSLNITENIFERNQDKKNQTAIGIFKTPVAAGRGSGERKYNIVPGHPEKSIIEFRINSVDPGIMMPELSRRLIHKEGVELIQTWIRKMDLLE